MGTVGLVAALVGFAFAFAGDRPQSTAPASTGAEGQVSVMTDAGVVDGNWASESESAGDVDRRWSVLDRVPEY